MRVVVTGANRGIGLELARQLLERGDQVEACAREPKAASDLQALASSEALRIHELDVTSAASIRALATMLDGTAVDVLINNAGTYGGPRQSVTQMAADLALEDVFRAYDVNAVGAMRMSTALLPSLGRGSTKKLVHITSLMGSIADNTTGGFYAYRMSKAALNMMSRCFAIDLRNSGVASIVINPGWVRTGMGGPGAPTEVADSVRGILAVIDRVTLADSGEFFNWTGEQLPW